MKESKMLRTLHIVHSTTNYGITPPVLPALNDVHKRQKVVARRRQPEDRMTIMHVMASSRADVIDRDDLETAMRKTDLMKGV